MGRHKLTLAERKRVEKRARKLLRSDRFFNEFLLSVKKLGLVGEQQNALVVLIVAISRLLPRPLNLFVKGHSSAGKNWLVTRVLRLMPKSAVAEITSASDKAWNYSQSDFRHRIVYLQERNDAAGTVHPIRLLISEGKLVRIVTGFENGNRVTKKHVARGPVASISTTTKNRLEIDDETRHISIWVDESKEQTRKIAKSYISDRRVNG
jgi:DNA primase